MSSQQYIRVYLDIPVERIGSVIDAYAHQGGYDPSQHGAGDGPKAAVALEALRRQVDQTAATHQAGVQVATEAAQYPIQAGVAP